ncbi:MAG: SpoIIE family protein phosphatase [Desulfobacterales bacterium]
MFRPDVSKMLRFRETLSKIPMKISLPLVFTAPVIVVVILLSAIAYIEANSAVNDLMAQNLSQIQDHIEERLEDLLNLPRRIQRVNANLIREGHLNLKYLRSWRTTLFEQAQAFKGLSSIKWGSADGRTVGISYHPGTDGYEFIIKDEETGSDLYEYHCDSHGRMNKSPTKIFPYDPRNRPWYEAAIRTNQSTWTEPYARMYKDRAETTLALGYAQPFRDSNGRLLGVMNAELTLNDITHFLENLSVGRTGKAFLMDLQGRLIATSSGVLLTDTRKYPVAASASADRQIARAAAFLEKEFKSYSAIGAGYQLRLKINREPYLLMISPSKHETGLTWLIATLVPENDFLASIKAGRHRNIKIGIVAVSATLLFGIVLAVISLLPMLDLIAYFNKVGRGQLDHEIKLEYSTEFVDLSKKINAVTARLRDHMRLRHALALAQEVQQNLLPSGTPDITGLDIASHATYCDETGGDYYDFLKIAGQPDTTVTVVVGDVVGHGMAAAMLMATARGILLSRCRRPGSLAELLAHLNNQLVNDTGDGRFMTMLLMTVDAQRKEMRWASAGHDAPFLYDPAEDIFHELNGSNMSLGLKKKVGYDEHIFTDVKSGQIYMAPTDGLWEAFNQNEEMFGKDRVRDLIRRHADLSAADICQRINAALSNFLEGKHPEDDLTFVIVKVK